MKNLDSEYTTIQDPLSYGEKTQLVEGESRLANHKTIGRKVKYALITTILASLFLTSSCLTVKPYNKDNNYRSTSVLGGIVEILRGEAGIKKGFEKPEDKDK